MQDEPLRPATTDELVQALSFALRYQGRRRVHHADDFMGQAAAERLAAHLEHCGFVVMKKPPIARHRTPGKRPM